MLANEIDISLVINGNEMAIKQFARISAGWVYNVIYNYVQNEQDAEELTQDAVMAALKNIEKFKNESTIKTWITSIALNKCRDFVKYKTRKKRKGYVLSLFSDNGSINDGLAKDFEHPGAVLESKEQVQVLFDAINQLNESQKMALILAKLDQKSQKEISDIMNISTKAVESLIARAKNNLKKILESEGVMVFKNANR